MKNLYQEGKSKLLKFLREEEGKNSKSNLIKAGVIFTAISAATSVTKTAQAQACACPCMSDCVCHCSVIYDGRIMNDAANHQGYHYARYTNCNCI